MIWVGVSNIMFCTELWVEFWWCHLYSLGHRFPPPPQKKNFNDVWHWCCTCTTEQSSFSDSDTDGSEHQVRSISFMVELSYWSLNMGNILTAFLTARQNSTSDREAGEVTSSESGEATELNVSMFPWQVCGFMDLSNIICFSILIFNSMLIFHWF